MLFHEKNMTLTFTGENKIKALASFTWNVGASFLAVTYGPLYFRHLENDKAAGLKYNGNFDRESYCLLMQRRYSVMDSKHW